MERKGNEFLCHHCASVQLKEVDYVLEDSMVGRVMFCDTCSGTCIKWFETHYIASETDRRNKRRGL